MILSKESIEEFREIYESEFGERLSFGEAEKMAKETIELFKMLVCLELPDEENYD